LAWQVLYPSGQLFDISVFVFCAVHLIIKVYLKKVFMASCIILAGGRNLRMNGLCKANLLVDSRPLIAHKLELFLRWFAEVIVVCNSKNRYDYPEVKIVIDEHEGCGPLMGLYTGLKASSYDINFVTACDMPFINKTLVEMLVTKAQMYEAVVPVVGGLWEPMVAVYQKHLTAPIHENIEKGRYKMTSFFDQIKVYGIDEEQLRHVDPELKSFVNINTPNDLVQFRRMCVLEKTKSNLKQTSCNKFMPQERGGYE